MTCPNCGKSNDDAAHFCRHCGSTLLVKATSAGTVSAPVPYSLEPKSIRYPVGKVPTVALFCSLVLGLGIGQFYNGDFKRGLLIIFLYFVVAIPLAPATFFLSIIAVRLWETVNAYNVAACRTPLWS